MKRASTGFLFQAASLMVATLLVHVIYVTVVWPRSEAILAAQQARMQTDPGYIQERSIWVILRDYEQETEIILMLWALAVIGQKWVLVRRERRLLERELVPLARGDEDPARRRARVRAPPPGPPRAGAARASSRGRCSPPSTVSEPRAASPTPPPPPATSARARSTVSTRSCRCCATSPGPSPPSASSGRCAASATRSPRPTGPCRAISPA